MPASYWRRISLVLVIAGCVGLVWWAVTRTTYPVRNAPVAGQKIIAFGDSLVVGVGAETGYDFVSTLGKLIKRPIINAGVSGDTTATALQRIDSVLKQKPDLVIVLLGGNDALQRVPVDQTIGNLHRIIATIQENGAAVLLLGVRGGMLGDPFRRAYAKLARETGAAYLPNVLDSVMDNSVLMADDIHPNTVGYTVIAQRIAPILQQLIR